MVTEQQMTGSAGTATLGSRTLSVAVTIVLAGSWTMMMATALQAMYFEGTSEALARAAQARTGGIAYALVYVASAAAPSLSARRGWLVLLAAPGIVTTTALVIVPQAAAFLFALLATAATILVTLAITIHHAITGHRFTAGASDAHRDSRHVCQ